MIDYLKIAVVSAAVFVLGLVGMHFYQTQMSLGAAIPNLTTFGNPVAFSNAQTPGGVTIASSTVTGDAAISGGTLNVRTSNTATSTIIAGCFEFYATSTATAQMFQASSTPGLMISTYGSCPRL